MMKILDKVTRLEKALLDRLARRSDIARHPLELYTAIVDECEDAVEAGHRGARIFPYRTINVIIPTIDRHQRATAEAVFTEAPSLEDRVRTRLATAGCHDVEQIAVNLTFADGTTDEWRGREYALEFTRDATPRQTRRAAAARRPRARELHLAILAGKAAKSRYAFDSARVNLGRLGDVMDRQQRVVRQNHVAFLDTEDEITQSVSRAHAHIRFDATSGEARLHDDGSTHGTRVVRGGRSITVPHRGRGVALRDHDEVVLGRARVRVEVRPSSRHMT